MTVHRSARTHGPARGRGCGEQLQALTGERIAALEAVEPEKSGAREVDRGPDGERGSSVPQERDQEAPKSVGSK